jgi:hypothetical protein
VVTLAQQEIDRVGSMFDVFRLLTDEVRDLARELKERGRLTPDAQPLDEKKLAGKLKECLRVSVAVLSRRNDDGGAYRLVRFVGPGELQDADFVRADSLKRVEVSANQLPFWTVRASRPDAEPPAHLVSEPERLAEIATRGPRTAAELELSRIWFSLDAARPLVDRALHAAGVTTHAHTTGRTTVYAGEIVDPGPRLSLPQAYELLGVVAQRARAFLEAYDTAASQLATALFVAAFEPAPVRTQPEAAIVSAARFAQEIARSALEQGIVVRSAVSSAEGTIFEDVNGKPAVVSAAGNRVQTLLAAARGAAPHRAALALDGASETVLAQLDQRLSGWTRAPAAPAGAAIFIAPG